MAIKAESGFLPLAGNGEAENRFDSLPSEVRGAASATSPRSVSPKILFCSKGNAERITRGKKTNGKLYSDLTTKDEWKAVFGSPTVWVYIFEYS